MDGGRVARGVADVVLEVEQHDIVGIGGEPRGHGLQLICEHALGRASGVRLRRRPSVTHHDAIQHPVHVDLDAPDTDRQLIDE